MCGERGSLFRVVSTGESAKEGAGEEEIVTGETFDGRTLSWARGAVELLEAIGDYFLRKHTRHRIEKKARTQNLAVISTAFASREIGGRIAGNAEREGGQPKLRSSTQENGTEESAMADPASSQPEDPVEEGWSEGGWRRLLRAPEGVMRDRAREHIVAYAQDTGADEITLEIAEAGIMRAREKMTNVMEKGQK